uniref:Ribosomal protein S3 n=1 Tax=Eptatretus burgeri TaxID=7764 RepID=A0A8C4NDV2_EPTBU
MTLKKLMSKGFVADGVFKAELNEFLTRELAEDGYSGVEVRVTPSRTEVIILATRTQNVLGEKGRRIRELTSVIQKRFDFPEGNVEVNEQNGVEKAVMLLVLCFFWGGGVLGIKVKIMRPWDPSGKIGPKKPLPDHVSVVEPKEEVLPVGPISEQKGAKPELPAPPPVAAPQMPSGPPVPTA